MRDSASYNCKERSLNEFPLFSLYFALWKDVECHTKNWPFKNELAGSYIIAILQMWRVIIEKFSNFLKLTR